MRERKRERGGGGRRGADRDVSAKEFGAVAEVANDVTQAIKLINGRSGHADKRHTAPAEKGSDKVARLYN